MEIAKVIRNDEVENFKKSHPNRTLIITNQFHHLFLSNVHLLTKKMFHLMVIQHFLDRLNAFDFCYRMDPNSKTHFKMSLQVVISKSFIFMNKIKHYLKVYINKRLNFIIMTSFAIFLKTKLMKT